jgi:hypothetical protein
LQRAQDVGLDLPDGERAGVRHEERTSYDSAPTMEIR